MYSNAVDFHSQFSILKQNKTTKKIFKLSPEQVLYEFLFCFRHFNRPMIYSTRHICSTLQTVLFRCLSRTKSNQKTCRQFSYVPVTVAVPSYVATLIMLKSVVIKFKTKFLSLKLISFQCLVVIILSGKSAPTLQSQSFILCIMFSFLFVTVIRPVMFIWSRLHNCESIESVIGGVIQYGPIIDNAGTW